MSTGTALSTLGFDLHAAQPRIGGFIRVFFDAMDLSIDAADGAARHRNLLRDALPRISDALQWPADGPWLLMSLK